MTSESRVPLLPDAKLDEHGVCGYCRRAGIQTEPSAVQEARWVEELAIEIARLAEGAGAGWGIYADLIRAYAPAAVRAQRRRDDLYAHDCGCETCPDHDHRSGVPAPAPSVTEVTDAMVEAAYFAYIGWISDAYDRGETLVAAVDRPKAMCAALEAALLAAASEKETTIDE